MQPEVATLVERFLRYVRIDTQSDPASQSCPSTEKQKDLARVLVSELQEMGIIDAVMDENGYVYGTIPSNSDKSVPVICFCSHMDTSPDCSGRNVKPIVHCNYQGQDIILPDEPSEVIRLKDHPDLASQIGNDIITASGQTLLGADNKAGIAEIMEAAKRLLNDQSIKHGTIKILFTPDEEIGRGVDKLDLGRLAADFGYTVDGEAAGTLENETFSADGVRLTIHGVSSHPGFAKGKMENAIRILSRVIAFLPEDRLSPESTEGREGFLHVTNVGGTAEKAWADLIVRDFETDHLAKHVRILELVVKEVMEGYPNSRYELKVTEQYRNMKQVLDQHPQVISRGLRAIERTGLKPRLQSIRGGTDGSRLSFMGLPCANIFAGEHAFHSRQEWVSIQDMQKAVETLLHLAAIWEEES